MSTPLAYAEQDPRIDQASVYELGRTSSYSTTHSTPSHPPFLSLQLTALGVEDEATQKKLQAKDSMMSVLTTDTTSSQSTWRKYYDETTKLDYYHDRCKNIHDLTHVIDLLLIRLYLFTASLYMKASRGSRDGTCLPGRCL